MTSLLRERVPGQQARVDNAELFFDLVFVFAVTQVSHALLHHLSIVGAVQAAIMLLAMWWVWIYTAWATNWLDPTRIPIRILLFVLMLLGLVFSTSIPEAFGEHGLLFAGAYVTMQVGRCLFTAWAMRDEPENHRNFLRISAWEAFGGIFWIVGAFLDAEMRMAVWALALVIEYASPAISFWTPWSGRSTIGDLNVEGGHMAERASLFIIIALGESIMATGGTFAESARDASSVIAFLATFVGSVAMWWIYFNSASERGHHRIAHSLHAGRLASTVYTYMHTLIVAGIIVSAVADDLVLEHPAGEPAAGPALAVIVGGPALFLVGTALFQASVQQRMPWAQLLAVIALGVLAAFGSGLEPLPLAISTLVPLLALAAWDSCERLRR
jgi:low temperature requirement protein LtrA